MRRIQQEHILVSNIFIFYAVFILYLVCIITLVGRVLGWLFSLNYETHVYFVVYFYLFGLS